MLSINMRIFKTVLLIVSFGGSVRCLPVSEELSEASSSIILQEPTTAMSISTQSDTIDYYDQRQNGTENYRINVDGVVLVFAPIEALLLAGASDSNLQITNDSNSPHQAIGHRPIHDIDDDTQKNKTEPAISKTIDKPAFRLANFLMPLIHRIHHETRDMSVH